jgi:O-acetyl-ADP-ribose deacetylase (regulator of RNase III)
MEETDRRYPDGCPTGSAVISGAGNLSARYVLHAVGPVWSGGGHGEEALLASAYRRCLELAAENECGSVAFPSLSTGAYRFPIERASRIALSTAIEFLHSHDLPADVRFVLFDRPAYSAFVAALTELTTDSETK